MKRFFPKRDRWAITNRIVTVALTIMEEVDMANDIYVANAGDYDLRRRSQTVALASTAKLLGLMELAYMKYNIESNRIRYWTQLAVDARDLIRKWRKSDNDRYGKL